MLLIALTLIALLTGFAVGWWLRGVVEDVRSVEVLELRPWAVSETLCRCGEYRPDRKRR